MTIELLRTTYNIRIYATRSNIDWKLAENKAFESFSRAPNNKKLNFINFYFPLKASVDQIKAAN